MKPSKSQNLYEILGVPRHATLDEIRNAYEISRHTYKENSLATYSLFSDEENSEILKSVTDAYQTLYNPERRRRYDDQLNEELKRAGIGHRVAMGEQSTGRHLQAAASLQPARALNPHSQSVLSVNSPQPEVVRPSLESEGAQAQIQTQPKSESAVIDLQAVADMIGSVERFDGETLRLIRKKAGIEVSELAELTKIRSVYIQYLEDEKFEFLPAPVYIKGFVTIIAKTLSLPADRVAKEYMNRIPGYSQE